MADRNLLHGGPLKVEVQPGRMLGCCAVFENYKAARSSSEGEDLTGRKASAKRAPGASVRPREPLRFVRDTSSRVGGGEVAPCSGCIVFHIFVRQR